LKALDLTEDGRKRLSHCVWVLDYQYGCGMHSRSN
jgi:hypothetical protein